MKILFLDDDPNRWYKFFENVNQEGVTLVWVKTADDAVAALDAPHSNFTYVFLDHDLDPAAYVGTPKEPTGMKVVDYIVNVAHCFKGTQFVVHSLNPIGDVMTDKLVEAGLMAKRMPFAWLLVSIKKEDTCTT